VNLLLWSFHIRDIGVDGLKELTRSQDQYPAFVRQLLRDLEADECFYLATCNRVEFLVYSEKGFKSKKPLFTSLKANTFTNNKDIFTHLLEVACSLDSIVFGENQILGQIKNAFTDQHKLKLVGPKLSQTLSLVLREAKAIRTETQLSRLQTSISSVASKIINTKATKKSKILLVGYGETHKLLHKTLEKKGFKNIAITNRTFSKIPDQENVQKISWLEFNKLELGHFDVVSFATSSEVPLLTKPMLEKTESKLIIDLCVPPNAEKKLVTSLKAEYVGLDEIQKTLHKDKREAALLKKQLKSIVEQSVLNMLADVSIQSINSLITANIQKSFEIHELALKKELDDIITSLTFEQKVGLAQWSEKLIKKINHIHLKTYKEVVNVVQNQNRNPQK